jgi:cholera toxin transcriptional activator
VEGRTFRFGIFELDGATGELRKDGRSEPRLREQPLQILLRLLEAPQEVVTRDELRQRLWASDTFVDFDHGLNTAVNQLRAALGDSAASPRFIQTLPRKGYRFIAPVQAVEPGNAENIRRPGRADAESAGEVTAPPEDVSQGEKLDNRTFVLSEAHELPQSSRSAVRILFGLIQLMYLIFYVVTLERISAIEAILSAMGSMARMVWIVVLVSAAAGIPIRLYLLSAIAFDYRGLRGKFLKLFPLIFPLDEVWALAPFLMIENLGIGLALGATAALLYVPFAERSLMLMAGLPQNKNAQG